MAGTRKSPFRRLRYLLASLLAVAMLLLVRRNYQPVKRIMSKLQTENAPGNEYDVTASVTGTPGSTP